MSQQPFKMVGEMRLDLKRETRWHRFFEGENDGAMEESKFLDGTAAITLAELQQDWASWPEEEQREFCRALPSCKSPELPNMLRYLMEAADSDMCFDLAASISAQLPAAETGPFFVKASLNAAPGHGWNFFKYLAASGSPEALPTLQACLDRMWGQMNFQEEDPTLEALGSDVIGCMRYQLELGDASPDLREKFKALLSHPSMTVQNLAFSEIYPYFPDAAM